MQAIIGEPSIRKRGCVGASEKQGAGLCKINDSRAVLCGNAVALQSDAIGRCITCLINNNLDGNRNAAQRPDVLAVGNTPIDRVCSVQEKIGSVIDNGVDAAIYAIDPLQRLYGDLVR